MPQMDLSTLYNRALQARQQKQNIEQGQQAFQLQQQQEQMAQAGREAQFLISAFGEQSDDPQVMERQWAQALDALGRAGGDVQGLSPTFDAGQFRQIQGLAQLAQRSQGGAGIQFGAQETFKDEKGNLFFGTQRRNPRTGQVEAALSPVGGGTAQPVGQLSMVSSIGLTPEEQVTQVGAEATEKEKAKAGIELQTKPAIAAAVEQAKQRATTSTELEDQIVSFEANMPTLRNVVSELKDLAQTATYTRGGRVFDAAVRELGFEATEGATAAAKYSAIVSNQVLPLLKATLGAQFTDNERLALEATLGNQNLSPEEKQAQLDAFIEQKVGALDTLKREQAMRSGQPVQQAPSQAAPPAQPQSQGSGLTDQQRSRLQELRSKRGQ